MIDPTKLPSWLPAEVAASVDAAHPDTDTHAILSDMGPVVFRCPTKAEYEAWDKSRSQAEAAGIGLRSAHDQLAAQIAVYPDPKTFAAYIARRPKLSGVIVASTLGQWLGVPEKAGELPADLAERVQKWKDAPGSDEIHTVETDQGWLVLKVPTGAILDRSESERKRRGNVAACDVLMFDCLVHPAREVVAGWLEKRPMISGWVAGQLSGWAEGFQDELQTFP